MHQARHRRGAGLREAPQGLEVDWHSSHPPPRVRSRTGEVAGSKPHFSSVAAGVADDTEDEPAVTRRACAGAAASRCRSRFCGRSGSPRPRRRWGRSSAGVLFGEVSRASWSHSSSGFLILVPLPLRSCVSPDPRQLVLISPFLVWQRRRCSGPAGSGHWFWELFLKAPLSAHSCSPLSDFVSAQPLISSRALS